MSDALAPTLQATLGQVRVVSDEPGRSAIEYEVGPQMCHSGGVAQGGFVCAWIDTAMAHASISLLPGDDADVAGAEGQLLRAGPSRPGRSPRAGSSGAAAAPASPRDDCWIRRATVLAKASSTIRLIPREAVEASARRALA